MDKPVPFIETTAAGKLTVNKSALQYLQTSRRPVSVVAIVGKYRTGKSYLLNRLFNVNDGFPLGSSIQSKTKGIWLWVKQHPKDPTQDLILLDTEGLHDVEKGNKQHDIQLFTLAVLLSNCLVYNAVGTIDDTLMDQLRLVTELTENIRVKNGPEEEEGGTQFSQFFPSLFLVLRDFCLQLEINEQPCSAQDYMEHALKLKKGTSSRVNEFNLPRECICNFFPKRMCFTLCKPVENDALLHQITTVRDSQLKPEFLADSKACIEAIWEEAKPAKVEGCTVDGSRFITLADLYVKAMNNGAVPCIASAVDSLRAQECEQAVEAAVEQFQHMMESVTAKLPAPEDVVARQQKLAHDRALQVFHERALFDQDQTYLKKLSNNLENCYQVIVAENYSKSKDYCQQLLKKCFSAIQPQSYFVKDGYKAFLKDREKALEMYKSDPNKGPAEQAALAEFMENFKTVEDSIINGDKALDEKNKEIKRQEAERQRAEEKAKVMQEENAKMLQHSLRQAEEHQKYIDEQQKQFQEKQLQQEEKMRKDMESKEAEWRKLHEQGLTKQADQMREVLEELKNDKKKASEDAAKHDQLIKELMEQNGKVMEELKEQRKASEKESNGFFETLAGIVGKLFFK